MQCTYTTCFSILLAEMAEKIHALLPRVAEDVIEDDAEDDDSSRVPSRVPAGMTSYCQWLDAYWMFLFQTK